MVCSTIGFDSALCSKEKRCSNFWPRGLRWSAGCWKPRTNVRAVPDVPSLMIRTPGMAAMRSKMSGAADTTAAVAMTCADARPNASRERASLFTRPSY